MFLSKQSENQVLTEPHHDSVGFQQNVGKICEITTAVRVRKYNDSASWTFSRIEDSTRFIPLLFPLYKNRKCYQTSNNYSLNYSSTV